MTILRQRLGHSRGKGSAEAEGFQEKSVEPLRADRLHERDYSGVEDRTRETCSQEEGTCSKTSEHS